MGGSSRWNTRLRETGLHVLIMYTKEKYLQMIDKFNRMTFEKQMETLANNTSLLKTFIHIDIKGMPEDMKDEIGKNNWFKINHPEL